MFKNKFFLSSCLVIFLLLQQQVWAASFSQETYIKASTVGEYDTFGTIVVLSGNTLAVSAYQEDSNATGINGNEADDSAVNAGAVYIFVRNGETWSQQAYIKASNTDAGDKFGGSIALEGDTLVVGAYSEGSSATGIDGDQDDNSLDGSGAVYVFTRTDNTWSQQAYIKASNTDRYDSFGVDVALSGDTLVVGASKEDSNATGINGDENNNLNSSSGAAYVFVRNNGIWSQQAYIKASNSEKEDRFGAALDIDGDTIAVGAYFEDSSASGVNGNQADNAMSASGAVYIFTRTDGIWSQQAYLKASNPSVDDWFGLDLVLDGNTLVVGANQEDSNATGINGDQDNNFASNSGAAYVFTRIDTTWSQQAYLKASNTGSSDNFGYALSLDGDNLVVGANYEDSNATGVNGDQNNNLASSSGAAYVFNRSGETWTQSDYIKASNTEKDDTFGIAVAIEGTTLAVGAYAEDSAATGIDGDQSNNAIDGTGAVYVFGPSTDGDNDGISDDIDPNPNTSSDLDGDGDVDVSDLDVIYANYGSTTDLTADMDGDGIVDYDDIWLWYAEYLVQQ